MLAMKKRHKTGLAPGTMVHIGKYEKLPVRVHSFLWNREQCREEAGVPDEHTLDGLAERGGILWVNVDGLHDVERIGAIGARFSLHPLELEDIVNTEQRPKIEDFDDHISVMLKMLSYNTQANKVDSEHVTLVLGNNTVLSFQEERPGDVFGPLRDRLRSNRGNIRCQTPDYFLYSLMDAIVDNYFVCLERIGERIDEIEDRFFKNESRDMMGEIHDLKRELLYLRKSVWPLRDIIREILRLKSELVSESTEAYFRDLLDHAIQIIDNLELFREMLNGLANLHMSSLSMRLNEIMRVLTIISTIFIPLTFIAGVYGMNFKFMPEIGWEYGYWAIWAVMLTVALGMLAWFKHRKWF